MSLTSLPKSPLSADFAYGTWRLKDESPPPTVREIAHRLETCLELGIDILDTAEIYGDYSIESLLGTVFAENQQLRKSLRIITKCGIEVPSAAKPEVSVKHYRATTEHIIASAENSLRKLKTDHLDVLLIHRPDWIASADETAAALAQLIKSGKLLAAGVSNYSASQFDLLSSRLDQPLITNQIEFSLLSRIALYDGTLEQCEHNRIRPMAWSPLAGGLLFDPDDRTATRIRKSMQNMRDRYDGASDDSLAIAWLRRHPSNPVIVLGTSQADRLVSQAKDIQLSHEDWYGLWEAAEGHCIA